MYKRQVKTDAAVQAARTGNRQKVPVYQADLTMIQNTFMAALREVKKEIGNDFTVAQSLTKGITQQMFSELTKGQDVQAPTITPEMISAAVTQSAAGMDGVQKEALDKFGQALTDFLQSTLDHAQEKQNADPEPPLCSSKILSICCIFLPIIIHNFAKVKRIFLNKKYKK